MAHYQGEGCVGEKLALVQQGRLSADYLKMITLTGPRVLLVRAAAQLVLCERCNDISGLLY